LSHSDRCFSSGCGEAHDNQARSPTAWRCMRCAACNRFSMRPAPVPFDKSRMHDLSSDIKPSRNESKPKTRT
jgi:hypothetical protein